jgi:biopolymer transport protein ExbD
MNGSGSALDEYLSEDAVVVHARRREESVGDLDITPMIDIVFLLLIFFLVASIPDVGVQAQLPPARHGVGVNPRKSVIITLAEQTNSPDALVYLADGKQGQPLPPDTLAQQAAISRALRGEGGVLLPNNQRQQSDIIRQAVTAGVTDLNYDNVILKAERGVLHREVARVAKAIGSADADVKLNIAVLEEAR